jgi:hypothetical protein
MVKIPSLNKIIFYGILGATAIVFFRRAVEPNVGLGRAASEVGQSIGTFGSGFSSLGSGIQDFFSGIGTGAAQLFNPLFTLRDLIYGPQAGNQPAPTAATAGQVPAETPVATTPTTVSEPPASAPNYTTTPIPLTVQQATQAFNQGLVSIGFRGRNPTPNQLRNIFERTGYTVLGQQTQLYVNRRNELVRLRPTTAAQLVRRGYIRNL